MLIARSLTSRVMYRAFLLLAFCATSVAADSYGPFLNYRKVGPQGRYYVVVRRSADWGSDPGRGGSVSVVIAERKQGSQPVSNESDSEEENDVVRINPKVRVRKGDLVHGRVELRRAPAVVLISAKGHGIACLGVYGYNLGNTTADNAVILVNQRGTILHRKSMADTFDSDQLRKFLRTAGGIAWLSDCWFDEKRKQLVVIGFTAERLADTDDPRRAKLICRTIDFDSGIVKAGSERQLVNAVAERNLSGIETALDIAREYKIRQVQPLLADLVATKSLPTAVRIRAAAGLGRDCGEQGRELIRKAAMLVSKDQEFAIEHLATVFGDDAPSLICDVVRRHGSRSTHAAWMAFQKLKSSSAVPALIDLLRNPREPAAIDFAVQNLGDQGKLAEKAVPALIELLRSDPPTDNAKWTLEMTAMSLATIGAKSKDALPYLAERARKSAPAEWDALQRKRPFNSGDRFSSDYFINSYYQILSKTDSDFTPQRLRRTAPPKLVAELAIPSATFITAHDSSHQLAIGTHEAGANLIIVDTKAWKIKSRLYGDPNHVESIAFSRDGKYVLAAGTIAKVSRWDLAKQMITHEYETNDIAERVSLSSRGTRLVVGCRDGSIHSFEFETGKQQLELHEPTRRQISSLALSPDGRSLYLVSRENAILKSSTIKWTFGKSNATSSRTAMFETRKRSGSKLAVSPNGKWVVVEDWGGTFVFDSQTGKAYDWIHCFDAVGAEYFAFSDDSRILAIADNQLVVFYDLAKREHINSFRIGGKVYALAFCSDSKRLITSSWDGPVKVWDVEHYLSGTPKAGKANVSKN